jgi:hypothetical protein
MYSNAIQQNLHALPALYLRHFFTLNARHSLFALRAACTTECVRFELRAQLRIYAAHLVPSTTKLLLITQRAQKARCVIEKEVLKVLCSFTWSDVTSNSTLVFGCSAS